MRREKRNMKKFLACVLALVMIFGLAANVSAVGGSITVSTSGTPTNIGDVEVNVTEGAKINTYWVIVAWENLTFSYTTNGQRWNAEQHKYVDIEGGGFTGSTTADITVTNKSDVNITVTAAAADKSSGDGFKATLNKTTFDLASYADRAADAADTNTFTVSVSTDGTPSAGEASVADISVTINKKS